MAAPALATATAVCSGSGSRDVPVGEADRVALGLWRPPARRSPRGDALADCGRLAIIGAIIGTGLGGSRKKPPALVGRRRGGRAAGEGRENCEPLRSCSALKKSPAGDAGFAIRGSPDREAGVEGRCAGGDFPTGLGARGLKTAREPIVGTVSGLARADDLGETGGGLGETGGGRMRDGPSSPPASDVKSARLIARQHAELALTTGENKCTTVFRSAAEETKASGIER